ncbi:tryptophan synthase subunit alpha [Bacillaceae bacterium Marseille-Q3522]|nr:tryptophan synthase subunit alpha [Bacillaceae bacterium Marseille-Q3522]
MRLKEAFKKVQENGEKGFIPYIMAGDGGLDVLQERILFLQNCGVTAIEIGIPFSDPVADGPVIQSAGIRSLQEGTTLKKVLLEMKKIKETKRIHVPLIFMTYVNPVLAYGPEKLVADAKEAGIAGFIFPDLPIEEENFLAPFVEEETIDVIRLVTLTSPLARMKVIAESGHGFIYAVTVKGITGARRSFSEEAKQYLQAVKGISNLPVLAGFGISTPEQVQVMAKQCDGVIVGSKIVELFADNNLQEIEKLVQAAKFTPQPRD